MSKISYSESVRSFDHNALAALPAYHPLRQALSDISNQAKNTTLADLLAAVRDMTLTAPYADSCDRCDHSVLAWPHAVDRDGGGWLTCTYRCPECQHVWTCGYAASLPEYIR